MAARQAREHATAEDFDAFQFLLESPRVKLGEEFAAYAAPSFPANRPLLEGTLDLCHRVYQEFEYDPRATTVTTPVDEVLASRRGVCQDFAHVTIACLRSLGLAARYVSGYLRSGPKSVGAEASHAWLSVYCPGFGWLDFDPTNDVMPRLLRCDAGPRRGIGRRRADYQCGGRRGACSVARAEYPGLKFAFAPGNP
jgi:transglutaminase-like putative cysteine protease